MQMMDASGNFEMNAVGVGGGGWKRERADIEGNTSLDSCMQMISGLLLPVVLFSQQSRMFLFLIIARPDAKFSPATCCISEKANS